jgi:HlyD family secretion protein
MSRGRPLARPAGVIALLGLVALGVLMLSRGVQQSPPAPATKPSATPVIAVPAWRGTIVRTVPIAGTVRAATEVQLAARLPARVLTVPVREGDRVRQGALLVQLDDRDARAALSAAEAGVRAAEAALSKARSGETIRGAEIDSGVTTAEAAVRAARARLGQARDAARVAEAEAAAEARRAQAALDAARANQAAANRGARPAQQRQAEAAVTQAESAWRAARRALDDAQFLYDRGALTRARLEEAQTAESSTRAQLDSARAALEQAREGATPEEREAAAAQVRQAEASVEAAHAGERKARLARQDAAAAAAQIYQAEAGLRNARAGRAGKQVARDDIRAAAAVLSQAEGQQRQARQQVADTRLVSPVDGVVTLRAAEPGQMAQPGQPLVTVASGSLSLEAAVTASTVRALHPGQPVTLISDAAPGRRCRAAMHDVPSVPGPDGRSYTVRAALEPDDGRALAPGVRARGTVEVARATEAVIVPPGAIHRPAVGAVVWVAREGKAERRPVGIGIETDEAVEILSGIRPGEAVIVSGSEGLQPGAAIDVALREQGRDGT